ncbi:MAG: pyridoxal phosphate-dependent aminotransferase [Deltaproteobacteria bacterium]|nr:pyridoxal phosphate-dependent aminotransferase [Deltaproteobacteria bacterium]
MIELPNTATPNAIEQCYRRLCAAGRPPVRLFSGNPNEHGIHFPSDLLRAAYAPYVAHPTYQPHPKGLLVAREAIAQYYGEAGLVLSPEHLILTSGTSESLFYLFSLLASPGEAFLVPQPSYPLFHEIARLAHVALVPYQLDAACAWRLSTDALKASYHPGVRGLVLVSPNNPTGAVLSAQDIAAVVDWANQKNLPLICDEVFSEFYFGSGQFPRPMAIGEPRLCCTLNGISKMLALPALKLSWIAVTGEPSLRDAVLEHLETMADAFLSCHQPIQMALPALFEHGRSFLAEYRRTVARRRHVALATIGQHPVLHCAPPRGGFYVMLEVCTSSWEDDAFVMRLMEERGFFVHPGYFYDHEHGLHCVVSLLTSEESLQRGIAAIAALAESEGLCAQSRQ